MNKEIVLKGNRFCLFGVKNKNSKIYKNFLCLIFNPSKIKNVKEKINMCIYIYQINNF